MRNPQWTSFSGMLHSYYDRFVKDIFLTGSMQVRQDHLCGTSNLSLIMNTSLKAE